jgi:hypothetical protein
MRNRILATTLAGLAAASALGLSAASAQPGSDQTQCFYSHDWDGWKATPDNKTIFIRVGVNHIWRLDLARACLALSSPNAHLVTDQRGSGSICTANDLNLKVEDVTGFPIGCIVSHIAPLSHEEASELPRNLRP